MKDEANSAGRQEQKRLLDLLFTKLGSVEYEVLKSRIIRWQIG